MRSFILDDQYTHEFIVVAGLDFPEETMVDYGRTGSRQGFHFQLGSALEDVHRHHTGLVQLAVAYILN